MHCFQISPSNRQKAILILCALLYGAVTCAFALTRLYTYKASIDTATNDQVLWNIIHHGIPLCTTNPPFTPQNFFGFHFSPIVLLMLPFYALWPHVELLQIVQSLCFGFAGMALFYALKAAGAREWEAWAGCTLYWFNPFVLSAAIWDFHEIAFANLFIAIALWGLCARRFTAMLLALLLLLLTKEHYGLSVAGFGFLWGWRYRDWRRGIALMTLGMTALIILLTVVIPLLHGGPHFMWTHSGTVDRYSWVNKPWPTPLHTLYHLLFENTDGNTSGFFYLQLLLMSGLMLPLAAPFYLAAGTSDILANLLSTNPMPRAIVIYHSAAIIPVVVVAGYQGYRWLTQKRNVRKDWLVWALATLAIIISASGLTLLPFRTWELNHLQLILADRPTIIRIHDLLPPGGLTVQPNISMFFSQREAIYLFPNKIKESSAVIFHLYNPFSPLKFGKLPYGTVRFNHVLAFLQEPGWHIAYWQPPWLVMTRGKATRNERAMRADITQHINILEKNDPAPTPNTPF